ncbi:MAG: 6-pyruvoyl-tetrahydropterin synthase-related protein [Anaerolineae bacterium]
MTEHTPPILKWAAPLITVLLLIPFAAPFLGTAHPESGDGLLNLYRAVALRDALSHGDLWPRLLTVMHFGYGGLNFNYYAPLSYYLPAVLGFGLDAAVAYRLTVVAYALIAALGAYALGQRLAGPLAGIGLAAAFVYMPPYFGTFDRLSQLLAVALLPWVLWAFWRLAEHRRRADFALAVGLLALLPLAHNITTVYAAPAAAAIALGIAAVQPERKQSIGVVVAACALAAGLTAFFWLPALAEQDLVQLNRLDIPRFDYANNFLPVAQTFSPGQGLAVGLPQVILGAGGLVLALRTEQPAAIRVVAVGSALGFAISVFLTTAASKFLWDTLPLLPIILFPKRLLYAAGLFAAVLAALAIGLVAKRIANTPLRLGWVALCAAVLIGYAQPAHSIGYMAEPPRTAEVLDLHNFERETGFYGATSNGEFLPVFAREDPYTWRFTDRYIDGEPFARLAPNDALTVHSSTWERKSATLSLTASQPATLVFEWFYLPGCEVTVNGETAAPTPTDPEGLISVDVPAGDHTVRIDYGTTMPRVAGSAVSGVMLLAAVGLLVWWPVSPAEPRSP